MNYATRKGNWVWCYRKKVEAARQARLLLERDFIILDTETTGLDDARICDLAVIDSSGNVLFNQLLDPQEKITERASEIHGLTNAQLVGLPTFAEIAPQLMTLLTSNQLVIYNADFDTKVLNDQFYRVGYYDLVPKDWRFHQNKIHHRFEHEYHFMNALKAKPPVCAMELYAQFYGVWRDYLGSFKWQKLSTACEAFGIEVPYPAHSALGDCQSTLEVLRAMSAWLD